MNAGLEKAREAARLARENGEVKTVSHNWITKAKARPTSLKYAINAKCFECMGGTEEELPDPGWKKGICQCTAEDCPLFPHRPYRNSAALDSDREDELEIDDNE